VSDAGLSLIGALLSLAGALFFLIAAVGLLRLPDLFTRAHAPTKAATLGMLLVAVGSVLLHGGGGAAIWLEKALLVLFVMLTMPISTQMLVRGAAARGVPQAPATQGAPISQPIERVDAIERSGSGRGPTPADPG